MKSNRPPDPLNSTANLAVNGIGLLCCTNDDKVQIAFLRAPKHVLTLEIVEISAQGAKTTRPHTLDLGPNQQIFLSATNPAQNTSTFFETADFDRRNITKDFRFLTNLEGDVHQSQLELKNPKEVDITLLTVNNAHFFSRRLVGPVARVDRASKEATEFGMITSLVGADISCADGGAIVLQNDGGANILELEKKDGVRYEIIFQNICTDDTVLDPTDFVLNYTILSDPRAITFDLLPLGKTFSGDDSCNTGRVADTKDLTELLSIPTQPPA